MFLWQNLAACGKYRYISKKFQSWCSGIRVDLESCLSGYITLRRVFHKRHHSWGKSKVHHKMQSDMCPPLLAKGANCLPALKGGHLLSRGKDTHTAVKLEHISKTGEYKTDLICPHEQHDPWFIAHARWCLLKKK